MEYFFIDKYGEVVYSMTCDEETAKLNIPEEGYYTEVTPPFGFNGYMLNGEWIEKPASPGIGFIWNKSEKTWTDCRTPITAAEKVSQLKEARDSAINGGFEFMGHIFDSDTKSQSDILGAYIAVTTGQLNSVDWRLQDNTWVTLSPTDVSGLYLTLTAHVQNAFMKFKKLEELCMEPRVDLKTVNWDSENA